MVRARKPGGSTGRRCCSSGRGRGRCCCRSRTRRSPRASIEHSDFRADPWRRLAATLRSYLTIVYGSSSVAREEIRRLNALHRGIVGVGYSARDPELSLWVHATLIDSTIVANDAWIAPLSTARREAFYQETRPIGRAFGVPDELLPRDLAGFEAYLETMLAPGGPVRVSPTARDLAQVIFHPPLAPLASWLPPGSRAATVLAYVPPAVYDWTLWPSIGLLPEEVRRGYGLAWGRRERLVSRWLVAGWRTWRRCLPEGFREMPAALAADRRVRVASRRPGPPARGRPARPGRRPTRPWSARLIQPGKPRGKQCRPQVERRRVVERLEQQAGR